MNSQLVDSPAVSIPSAWKWAVSVGMVTFALQLWLSYPLIYDYFPNGDDIALEASSTALGGPIDPVLWLTEGFHNFFRPYPEWGSPPTNFWRPMANALFWIHYQIFGTQWGSQLALGYFVHALIVSMTAYISLAVFKLHYLNASIAILISALNPALWSPYPSPVSISNLLQSPIYQTEILCAFLMLAAFLAFVHDRNVLFSVLATLAVCLKETALTLPVSALALPGMWLRDDRKKSLKNFLLLAMPLAVWFFFRLVIFRHGFDSYATTSTTPFSWLIQPIRNALLWPTGLYIGPIQDTWQSMLSHNWRTVLMDGAELLANAAWWVVLLAAIMFVLRTWGRRWFAAPPEPWVAGLMFAGGNLALAIFLQAGSLRIGYLWFTLGPAALFAFLARWRANAFISAWVLGLAIALPQVAVISDSFSRDSIENYRVLRNSAKQLTGLLASLPPTVKTVYLVDDVVLQVTSPEYGQKLAGYGGRLVLINLLQPILHCASPSRDTPRYHLERDGVSTVLKYMGPPACFKWAWYATSLEPLQHGSILQRGEWLAYQFPELSVRKTARLRSTVEYDVGQRWTVRSTDPACANESACVWLGYDPEGRRYYVLKYDSSR